MNEFRFEDLSVGMVESFSREITEDMMREFLSITGDTNPLHLDSVYAREEGYAGKLVYGMLTASLISTWGGGIPPGEKLPDSGSGSEIHEAGILWGYFDRHRKDC